MDKKFYRVFRAGVYPYGTVTVSDIQEIADGYDRNFHEAVLNINHDDWSPALAVVDQVKVEGKDLLVSFDEITDEAYTLNNKYRKPSVEIIRYDKGDKTVKYLRAVTLTNFPMVKGMDRMSFNENSTVFFSEDITLNLNKGKKMVNEFLIKLAEKFGLTKDNKDDTQLFTEIESAVTALQTSAAGITKFTEAGVTVEKFNELNTETGNLKTQVTQLNTEKTNLTAEVSELKTKRSEFLKSAAIKFTEMTPAQAESLKTFADSNYDGALQQFDALKPKPVNPKLPKVKADGGAYTYEEILKDPELASQFSEDERIELRKQSKNFR